MRIKVAICAVACTLTANAQMWNELATSDWRVDTADVRALKLEVDNISFFRDNEYGSKLTKGYSLPGLWVQPKLTYNPTKHVHLELGLHALLFNGANKYPNYVYHDVATWKGSQYQNGAHMLPWFRAQMDFDNVAIVLGHIYGGENHGLIEPLWNTETNLSQDPEMGLQILWERQHLRADVWLNWQSYIFEEASHQEAFTVGSTWSVLLNDKTSRTHWYMPVQLVLQHRGGEQDTTQMGVQTICNASLGVGMRHRYDKPCLTHVGAEVNALAAYQQAGKLWPFTTGAAFHAAGEVMLWDALRFRAGYFCAPRQFVSLYGNPFFTTISRREDGYAHRGLHTAYTRVDFSRTIARHYVLGAEAEIYNSWLGECPEGKSSEFNFSFGLYLRVNPQFLIKRFK